jgi:hypothetical protein
MANWLDELADRDDSFKFKALAMWVTLRAACASAVETYNSRYVPGGATISNCTPDTLTCFAVTVKAPSQAAATPTNDRHAELTLDLQQRKITIRRSPAVQHGASATTTAAFSDSVDVGEAKDDGAIHLFARMVGPGPNASSVEKSENEVSELVLQALFFPGAFRPLPVK